MGCRSVTRLSSLSAPSRAFAPLVDLIPIEYLGLFDMHGYEGSETGHVYLFGLFHQKGYVARADLPKFLSYIEDGSTVFREVSRG